MRQSLQSNLSKIYWYVVCIGVVAGCSACINPSVEQPDETNKQGPLGPTPNRPRGPGAGEPPSDPPAQPSPFQQAVQQLKDDPAKKEIYDFFVGYDYKKREIPKDTNQVWDTVIQRIGALGSLETATWLIEEGHLKVNEPDQKGELPLEKLLKNWIDKGERDTKTDENSRKLFTRLQAEGATIPKDKATDLLAKAGEQEMDSLYKPLIETGANPDTELNDAGKTVLYYAIAENKDDLVDLLEAKGVNVNAEYDLRPPAIYAALHHNLHALKTLLKDDALEINTRIEHCTPGTLLNAVIGNCVASNIDATQRPQWLAILEDLLKRPELEIHHEDMLKAKCLNARFQPDSEQAKQAQKVLSILQEAKKQREGN